MKLRSLNSELSCERKQPASTLPRRSQTNPTLPSFARGEVFLQRLSTNAQLQKVDARGAWMIHNGRWVLLSIACLVPGLCKSAEPEQPARIAISGQVVDAEGAGVAGIDVRGIAFQDNTHATTDPQ